MAFLSLLYNVHCNFPSTHTHDRETVFRETLLIDVLSTAGRYSLLISGRKDYDVQVPGFSSSAHPSHTRSFRILHAKSVA